MRKRYLVLAVLIGALYALISKLPLGWIAPPFMPKEAGENLHYSGTIWQGQVTGLDYIGRAQFKLSPKAFISGGLPLNFKTVSSAIDMSGQASLTKLKDFRFAGRLSQLPIRDGRLNNLTGNFNALVQNMKFGQDCQSANGRVNTDFLKRNQAIWQWTGPVLAGPLSCEGGDLIVNLSGSEANQTIRADLRLSPKGSYIAEISVQTRQAEAGVLLPIYGFEAVNGEFRLTERGQWR